MVISYVSFPLARFYLWRSQMFNFMLVGASGCILGWFLFNIFRPFLVFEFLAWVVTTLCVFMWNYTWNKVWSLNAFAQLNFMKRTQLQEMGERIGELLERRENESQRDNSS
jgi:putative flippase GtrA